MWPAGAVDGSDEGQLDSRQESWHGCLQRAQPHAESGLPAGAVSVDDGDVFVVWVADARGGGFTGDVIGFCKRGSKASKGVLQVMS